MQHVLFIHINRKLHVASNFSYLLEDEGLLKVTSSHVHCQCGSVSETAQESVVITTDH